MDVSERIKTIRKENHLTQRTFAEELGISQTHISKIENNVDTASSQLIHKISRRYGICPDWILYGMEPKYLSDLEIQINHIMSDLSQLNDMVKQSKYCPDSTCCQKLGRIHSQLNHIINSFSSTTI